MCLEFSKSCKSIHKFCYADNELENVDEYTYLGIKFHKSGTFTKAINDRITKASKAIYVLKQALSTVGNVNVKLAMSIYDKQIQPIINYGCANWALPSSSTYMYLDNIPNDVSTNAIKRNLVANEINTVLCKRVGKSSNTCRPFLLNLSSIEDKMKLLRLQDLSSIHEDVAVRNYDIDCDKLMYEKLHTRYCKFTLNVSKFSSNYACRAELGRYPLCFKMWNLCIQYWLRLENGTNNPILNET